MICKSRPEDSGSQPAVTFVPSCWFGWTGTGKDQRGGALIHSEDVFDHLTQKAGVPPEAIRRQTAELKELKDDDLLSLYCGVRVIITRDALREGWDCPFAYVLAILSRGTAGTALTQMIGRVLRQPQATLTGVDELDQTHVFCADVAVGEAIGKIKAGLEAEGLGDIAGEITIGQRAGEFADVKVQFRQKFRGSRIMVPRVLYREGKRQYRDLDFEADVLAGIDFGQLSFRNADEFNLADYDVARKESFAVDFSHGIGFDIEVVAQESERHSAIAGYAQPRAPDARRDSKSVAGRANPRRSCCCAAAARNG